MSGPSPIPASELHQLPPGVFQELPNSNVAILINLHLRRRAQLRSTLVSMSVFLEIPESDWVAQNDHAFAIRDAFPVNNGHSLIITKQVVPTWFDASPEQRQSLMELVDEVKVQLEAEFNATAFNIGINVGSAAGQTVNHLHVHVIPRFPGDVSDPRGGVRNVIPSKANYLATTSELFTPSQSQFRKALLDHFNDKDLDQIDLVVAFVMRSGLNLVRESLEKALQRGAKIRILTTDYLMTTDPSALGLLLDIQETEAYGSNLLVRIFSDSSTSFHPKAYLFRSSQSHRRLAFVGSSNLSKSALMDGIEWNVYRQDVDDFWNEFELLWNDPRSVPLTHSWLSHYLEMRHELRTEIVNRTPEVIVNEVTESIPKPWSVQQDALDALALSRIDGHRAGLVVMATGLGKTWLAAFDSSRPSFKRVLFIAHRIEILKAARDVFRKVRVSDELSLYVGGAKDMKGKVVFAGIQLLQQNLHKFDPNEFDYIVVDEFHHATAPTYREIIDYFNPRFLLGLTATPDRSDNADLLALCQDNLAFECGLVQGLERELLSPFNYRAIKDVADYENIPWKSGRFQVEELTASLATQERAHQVLEEWLTLGGPTRRTLAFCCSQAHADFMREFFTKRGHLAASVHSGASSDSRSDALADLEAGSLPIIFSVDLFNEGVDVPAIDCIFMLRPTESAIIFFQQLGRGLRKSADKDHLEVVDLVGNHHSFLAKAGFLLLLAGKKARSASKNISDLEQKSYELPSGCSISVDLEALDLMKALVAKAIGGSAARQALQSWIADHESDRPTALQFCLYRGKDLGSSKKSGGWFGLLHQESLLSPDEDSTYEDFGDWFTYLEFGAYSKSFKLLTLLTFSQLGGFEHSVDLSALADACRKRIFGDPRLLSDLEDATSYLKDVLSPTEDEWLKYWTTNPISALTKPQNGEVAWMTLRDGQLDFSPATDDQLSSLLSQMTTEICEYRLHRYLAGRSTAKLFPRLQASTDDGAVLDAGFRVESQFGRPVAIFFESAGYNKNPQYVQNADLVLKRLGRIGARLVDAYVDSSLVKRKQIALADLRLVDLPLTGYIELSEDDSSQLLKDMLRRMPSIGRATTAKKGGGNSRKAMRILLDGVSHISARDLSDFLVSGKLAPGVESNSA